MVSIHNINGSKKCLHIFSAENTGYMYYKAFADFLDMGGWDTSELWLKLYQQKCQIITWTALISPLSIRGDWCPDKHWITV